MTLLRLIDKILKKIAEMAGFDLLVVRNKTAFDTFDTYEIVSPAATYAPWLPDSSFNDTYKIIKDYTFVDKYRCYELWQLVEESTKLNGALIEIGVWRGGVVP